MDIVPMTPSQVSASAIYSLGLGQADVDLFSSEALAASLRRAASFLCPAAPGHIVRAVAEVLDGLPGYSDDTRDQLSSLVDALVGYGDLLELEGDGAGGARRLYLGAPAFVMRRSGACLLVGIRPDGANLTADDLAALIEYEGHARFVPSCGELGEMLAASGLTELSADQWLRVPRRTAASELVGEYGRRLQAAGDSGDIENPRILDPATPVTFYRGRWRSPGKTDAGDFIARRPQAYGADLWCYARLAGGRITRLVDFPPRGSLLPGADEAWRLQSAIDAAAGHSQQVRVRDSAAPGRVIMDFFSPIPSWAQRRLDIIGTPLLRGPAALFSYSLPAAETAEELGFLASMLWITSNDQPERTKP